MAVKRRVRGVTASPARARMRTMQEETDYGLWRWAIFHRYSITPAALGKALEERGFELVWAAEHSHIPLSRRSPWPGGGELPKQYYDVMDPFVTLTAAAGATTK